MCDRCGLHFDRFFNDTLQVVGFHLSNLSALVSDPSPVLSTWQISSFHHNSVTFAKDQCKGEREETGKDERT